MTNVLLSQILSEEKSFDKIESYHFTMDSKGPKYFIKFNRNYNTPFESISKGDYYFKMMGSDKIISEKNAKMNLFGRLYTNINSLTSH